MFLTGEGVIDRWVFSVGALSNQSAEDIQKNPWFLGSCDFAKMC